MTYLSERTDDFAGRFSLPLRTVTYPLKYPKAEIKFHEMVY